MRPRVATERSGRLLAVAVALFATRAEAQITGRFQRLSVQFLTYCESQDRTLESTSPTGSITFTFTCQGSTSSATLSYSFPATTPPVAGVPAYFDPPLPITTTFTARWTTPPSPPAPAPPYRMTAAAGLLSSCYDIRELTGLPAGTHTMAPTKACQIGNSGFASEPVGTLNGGFSGTGYGGVSYIGRIYYDFSFSGTVTSIAPSAAPNTVTGVFLGDGFFKEPLTATITGTGFVDGAKVAVGTDVSVLAVRWKSGTDIEVDLGGFHGLPEGPRDVTVTNPDGSKASAPGLFHVSSLTVAPLIVNQGVPVADCPATRPCVADHDTVIRVRVSCNGTGCELGKEQTRGLLHVIDATTRAPVPGSPFEARPDAVEVLPSGTDAELADRAAARDTLTYSILGDGALAAGTYDLAFEVDPRRPDTLPARSPAPDTARNLVRRLPAQVFARSRADRGLKIGIVLDSQIPPRPPPFIREAVARVFSSFDFVRATYPVSADLVRAERMPCAGATVEGDDESTAWPFLIRCFQAHNAANPADPYTHVVLFTASPAFESPGVSDCDPRAFFSPRCRSAGSVVSLLYGEDVPGTVAHEIGHHFDLGDTYLGAGAAHSLVANQIDHDTCQILQDGCLVADGTMDTQRHDVSALGLGFFRDYTFVKRDFMGNAPRRVRWVDERSWSYLYGKLMLPLASRPAPLATGEWITLSGMIGRDGTAELFPFARFTGPAEPRPPAAGEYALRLEDAAGTALAETSFDRSFETADRPRAATRASFVFTLPYPPGTSRVVLRKGGLEIASRRVSPNAPVVRVASPNGSESLGAAATVSWTASDADGDALTYDVLYTADGTTWLPLATALTATSFAWDTSAVAGTRGGRIRVVASDGVHSATDDSDGTFAVGSKPPECGISEPRDGTVVTPGQLLVFRSFGLDAEDGALPDSALSLSSSRDGALGTGRAVTAILSPGAHTLTLTATDRDGNRATASIGVLVFAPPAQADAAVLVPIVLSTAGVNDAFFTSELTLTNRGATDATVELAYTPAFGGGVASSGLDVLPAGRQKVVSDALGYLASLGVAIPTGGNRGGTLTVRFYGLSSPRAGAATVRTATAVPKGRAGLSYPAVPPAILSAPIYLTGLRQTESDRSNVAVLHAGQPSDGDVSLRLTVYSGEPARPVSQVLPEVTLAPGAFTQISGILASNGLSVSNGYVRVERVAGTAPFYAYGVINDQVTSDGSFVPPVPADALKGRKGMTVPVIVETAAPSSFSSELVATNWSGTKKTVRLSFVSDAVGASGAATFTLEVGAGEQVVIPALVQYLRDRQVAGIGPAGPTFAGALFAEVDGGDAEGLFLGARTSSAAAEGGRFGLFYPAVPYGAAATDTAWVYGLQQDAENRSNLALVNTGEVDGSGSAYRVEIHDGETGLLVKTLDLSLPARRWAQLSGILSVNAPDTRHAYAKVVRTSGSNPFVVYGVINDGGTPGVRSDDGAFVAMDAGP